jgi:hypothetical protein
VFPGALSAEAAVQSIPRRALTLAVVCQEVVKDLYAYDEATDVSQVKVHRSTVQLCLTNVKYYYGLLSSVWLALYTNLTSSLLD